MAKLHELLAVSNTLEAQVTKCTTDLKETFSKKRHLFEERITTFIPSEEGQEPKVEEQQALNTTVGKELKWISDHFIRLLNVDAGINMANTQARADVVLEGGTTLLKDQPTTALMELGHRLATIQELISTIPTLDPVRGYQPDSARGTGVWKARDIKKTRTQKKQKPIVLYDATPEHPAQTQIISEDVPIGEIQIQEWSGMISPAEKADMLARCEALSRAVKQARSRANDTDVTNQAVGSAIMDYIVG